MTDLLTKEGRSKLVETCELPLTGIRCVDRIYTDRAVFDMVPTGAIVIERFGTTLDELRAMTWLDLEER
jgi:3-oxoadipate CoA-transferase beta subunit